MKAIVVNTYTGHGEQEVTDVIMVSNDTPSLDKLHNAYGVYLQKIIDRVILPSLGEKARTKRGLFTNKYFKAIEKYQTENNDDFKSWIMRTYDGYSVDKFEEIYI